MKEVFHPYYVTSSSSKEGKKGQSDWVSRWLMSCLLLLLTIIIVGGLTRLTDSGLSMVNWHPIYGIIPPMNEAEWLEEFAAYQQSPEFIKINYDITLDGFKKIFWYEYIHRMLGRAIGLLLLIPFIGLCITQKITRPLFIRIVPIIILVGLQGVIGWYMVKSGLADNPHVSQYRLAIHLGMATLILYKILSLYWLYRDQFPPMSLSPYKKLRRSSTILFGLLVIQILSGALVAGLDAGKIYNSFPLMGGQWVPDGIWFQSPWYSNLFENHTTVQFMHRLQAYIIIVAFGMTCYSYYKSDHQLAGMHHRSSIRTLLMITAILLVLQVIIGIATLLWNVPITTASLHQLVAFLLFSTVITLRYRLYYAVDSNK